MKGSIAFKTLTFKICKIILIIYFIFSISIVIPWPRRNKEYFFQPRFHYTSRINEKRRRFPNLLQENISNLRCTEAEVYASIIIPAMNEIDRLPIMLDECLEYLNQRQHKDENFTYEVYKVLATHKEYGSHNLYKFFIYFNVK